MHAGTTNSVSELMPNCTQPLDKLLSSSAVLVVDEEPNNPVAMQQALKARCALLEMASSAEEAEALRLRIHFDLLLVNTRLPGLSGLAWVRQLRERGVQTHVIYTSAHTEMTAVVEALRNGADDFLVKPFNTDQLLQSIHRSLSHQSVVRKNSLIRFQLNNNQNSDGVIGDSAVMKNTLSLVHRVAPTQTTILLQGETGTGKELIAQTIHNSSHRTGEFVAINCGSIAPELFESELFGHVKGAFTGATQSRDGLLLHANKGTVFLDEVSELPAVMQTKLLRVLEERVIRPVGSEREIPVDVRIIAATNRDLSQLAESEHFRQDLYFRLNVFLIEIPPLRNRIHDVESLVNHFMNQLCIEMKMAPLEFMHTDWQRLKDYDWPGNVRELRNVIERTLLLGRLPADSFRTGAKASIQAMSLSENERKNDNHGKDTELIKTVSGFPTDWTLANVERSHIEAVLESVNHNKSAAARILGVSRKTLERKEHLWYPEIYSK